MSATAGPQRPTRPDTREHPLIGAHVSTSGALEESIARGRRIGAEVIQIFPSNPRQWRPAPYTAEDLRAYGAALRRARMPLFVHTIYLINLASPDPALRQKSAVSLADALHFGALTGAAGVVTHIGSHRGDGFVVGAERVARSLEETYRILLARLDAAAPSAHPAPEVPELLLESSAGGGDSLGRDIAELGRLLQITPGSTGVCLDTAHLYAAGYPLHTEEGVDRLHHELGEASCLHCVGLVHLNDSKSALGSRSDRHENLWDGLFGRDGLRGVMASPYLARAPFVLEVPGVDGHGPDRRNIRRARILRREASALRGEASGLEGGTSALRRSHGDVG
jgi:deoxyribonuclease-4